MDAVLYGFVLVWSLIIGGAAWAVFPSLALGSKKQQHFDPQPVQKAVQSVVNPTVLPATAMPEIKDFPRTVLQDMPKESATVWLQDKGNGTIGATAVEWATFGGVKKELRRISLGDLPGSRIEEALVVEAMRLARAAIRGEEAIPAPVLLERAESMPDPVLEEIKLLMPLVLEQQAAEQGVMKALAKPFVVKGELLRASKMTKDGVTDGKTVYGAIVRQDDGKETTLWGAGLKVEIAKAGVKPGDQVEIIKLGRKTIEEGKAPMNVYKVSKLIV